VSDGFIRGTVLWFRPEAGRGVVKGDDGRQFFFDGKCGVDDPVKGLLVHVRTVNDSEGTRRVELQLPQNGRQFTSVNPVPAPAATKRRTVKSRSSKDSSTKVPRTGPKSGVVKRVVRTGESLERGISVFHPTHGQGFVVLSTRSMARIRFMPSQEERSVRVDDLEVLEGN